MEGENEDSEAKKKINDVDLCKYGLLVPSAHGKLRIKQHG